MISTPLALDRNGLMIFKVSRRFIEIERHVFSMSVASSNIQLHQIVCEKQFKEDASKLLLEDDVILCL